MLFINLLCCVHLSFSQFIETPGGPDGGTIYGLEQVGNEIWAASSRGIYISQNEGLTWNISPIIAGKHIGNILAEGDTILLFYGEDTLFQIRSTDLGQTWSVPMVIISGLFSSYELYVGKVQHTARIDISSTHLASTDMGLTWNPVVQPSLYTLSRNRYDKYTSVSAFYNPNNSNNYLYVSTNGQQSWQLINSTFPVVDIYVDSALILVSTGEVSGANFTYKIYRSTDAGQNWSFIDSFANNVQFYQKLYHDTIYFSTYASTYGQNYASYDRGLTWDTIPLLSQVFYDPIFVSNANIIDRSDNYGYFGVEKYIPSLNKTYTVNTGIHCEQSYFVDAHQNVLYTRGRNCAYRSFDAGNTWHVIDSLSLPYSNLYDMNFKGDSIFALEGGTFYRSFDNGNTWAHFTGVNGSNITRLGSNLYVGSPSSYIYESSDWGATWDTLPQIDASTDGGRAFAFKDTLLLAATESGPVYKFDFSTHTWVGPVFSASTPGVNNYNRLYDLNGIIVFCGGPGMSILFSISSDGGNTWATPLLQGLPSVVNFGMTLTLVPEYLKYYNGVWIGSIPGYGFYVSADNGDNWQQMQAGQIPFHNGDFSIMNGIIYAGSTYSSVWRSAGTVAIISGDVYFDVNDNGTKEVGESYLANKMLASYPTNMYGLTDNNGHYVMLSIATGDSIKPVLSNYATHSNPTGLLTNGQAQTQDFGLFIPPNLADLSIDISNVSPFQPGFDTYLTLTCKNEGSLSQAALVKFLPDSNMNVLSTTPPFASQIGDTLIWNTNLLNYNQLEQFSVLINTSASLSPLGDSVKVKGYVLPINNDIAPANNYILLHQPVVGSYDPNDKSCALGTQITTTQVSDNEELIYTIRFQNTGTFPTTFVYIEDTLDAHLDVSTFHVIAHSHSMNCHLQEQGYVKFDFNPLSLPPSSTNDPESHGFVKYGIRCKIPTELGTGITNTAHIYFDFNAPIITNTVSTQVVLPQEIGLSIPHSLSEMSPIEWIIYPNPTESLLYMDISENIDLGGNILLFDYTGKLLQQQAIYQQKMVFYLDNMPQGLYICVLTDKTGRYLATAKIRVNH